MHPTLFHVFGIQITTYGLMVTTAFMTLWFSSVYRGVRLGYASDFIQNLLTVIVISAMLSARLLYVMINLDYFFAHPAEILLSRDGYVFLGGFLGGVVGAAWYVRRHQKSILGVADLFAPYLALAQAIGRVGCFLFGCCYGKVCALPWAVRFPQDSPAYLDHLQNGLIGMDAVTSLPVHPAQLYGSAFNLVHFFVLLAIRRFQRFRGQVAMSYLVIYSFARFGLEMVRGDYRGAFGGISTSQWLSLVTGLAGAYGFWILLKRNEHPEKPLPTPKSESLSLAQK